MLTPDEVTKYKLCSPGNGAGAQFVPYQDWRSGTHGNDASPQQYVVIDQTGVAEVDYSAVKYCSNPTW